MSDDSKPMTRTLSIDISDPVQTTPLLFGYNLEHTRGALYQGLSAQLIRNRKFSGRPLRNLGVAKEWFAVGDRAFFCNDVDPYQQHVAPSKMPRRNELSSQTIQNAIEGQRCGIGQADLPIRPMRYEMAVVAKAARPVTLCVQLTDAEGEKVYAETTIRVETDEFTRYPFELTPSECDDKASLRISFTERVRVRIGAVSMLPEGHFYGMRRDVVELFKAMHPGLLRWPGGNFAGEYRWQDMFLPVDMRGALEAATEEETQPYSHGYDYHEIDTDDFIALCREVGAEPYITVNLAWETPEEIAAWVEYCNGDENTEYGRRRIQRGHKEPYNVKHWSLGNEIGYRHMEGVSTPAGYAALARTAIRAMRAVTPDLHLTSSGPYYQGDHLESWIHDSAEALYPEAGCLSYHTYNHVDHDVTDDEAMRQNFAEALKVVDENMYYLGLMRDATDPRVGISFDEWNMWASWFRAGFVFEGMYAVRMMHAFLEKAEPMNLQYVCYFQPIGEGCIRIKPYAAGYTAMGQALRLTSVHKGGALCRTEGAETYGAVATLKDGVISLTVMNEDFDRAQEIVIPAKGFAGASQEAELLVGRDLLPGGVFDEETAPVEERDGSYVLTLPARSVALVQFAVE